jgi:type VI secretion system protein VasG
MPEPEGIATALREPLLKTFPAALLGRLVAIPYFPLNDEMLAAIIRLQLGRVARRIEENHRIDLSYTDGVVDLIGARCAEVESGARVVDAILTNTLLPEISRELLTREMEGRRVASVSVDVGEDGFSYGFVDAQ